MLKIVYRVCCGMDVHKSFVVACIASTNEYGVTTYKSKRFSTSPEIYAGVQFGFLKTTAEMCAWNLLGSIGFPFTTFWNPLAILVLAHPKYVKAIRGKKTDKRDAKWIADIFKHDLVAGVLSLRQISASFVIWCVTDGNSPTLLL